jgi:hypothetical protein
MKWTAWKAGRHAQRGVSYGLYVPKADREAVFDDAWTEIYIELPYPSLPRVAEANLERDGFGHHCGEVISKDIRDWLYACKLAPWKPRRPPIVLVRQVGSNRFAVEGARPR